MRTSAAQAPQVYDIALHTDNLAKALNDLSEQTGVPVVFSYDLVKDRIAHPVVGRFTLPEALNALLKDSGLSGGLSEKGVLTVFPAKPAAQDKRGETLVTNDDKKHNTNRPARIASLSTFLAAVAAAFTANAQDVSDTSVDADSSKLDEVLVTAEKREERLQDVPESLTVLNADNLAENGQTKLIDYFSSVPGLNLTAEGNGNTLIVMRGLSTGGIFPGDPTSGQNPMVATVVDDVPVTSSTAGGGGAFTSPDLDPNDLARVEVLKGPQGTLYGANSMGGLIKYVTLDPSVAGLSGRVQVAGEGISGGGIGYAVRGAVNVPVSDTFALRISGFDRRDPGYIDDLTTGKTNFNSSHVSGGHVAAWWHPSDNLTVKLTGLVQQTNGDDSYFDSTVTGESVHTGLGLTVLPGGTRYSTQIQLYSANVDWKADGFDITSITGYVVNSFKNLVDWTGSLGTTLYNCHSQPAPCTSSDLPPGVPPGMFGSLNVDNIVTHKVTEELRVGSAIGQWLDWRLGGFYTHESSPTDVNSFYGNDPNTGAFLFPSYTQEDVTQEFHEYAVFGDLTAHLTDQFDVEAGGRESWNHQKNQSFNAGEAVYLYSGLLPPVYTPLFEARGNAFTYEVSPKFKFSRDLMVYLRISTGYRVGGFNQAAFKPIFADIGIPQSFSPDKTTNYEVGFKGSFLDNALTLNAAAYHIRWSDFQANVTRLFTIAGGTTYLAYTVNEGQAKSDGVELSLEAHPYQGLTIALQGSYDHAVLTQDLPNGDAAYGLKGFPLPYSLKFSGGISANQDIRLASDWIGFFGFAVTHVGSRPQEFTGDPTQARIEYPAYTQLNLRMGVRHDTWLMNLVLNNATNTRGVVGILPQYSLNSPQGYEATVIQPRTVGLSIAKTF